METRHCADAAPAAWDRHAGAENTESMLDDAPPCEIALRTNRAATPPAGVHHELAAGHCPGWLTMDPFVFEPYVRPMIWGSRRLEHLFGKALPAGTPCGESWEVSAHPQHVSQVAEGPYRGTLLSDLCQQKPAAVLGDAALSGDAFPLLIKLLDCHEKLSVQVHPNDDLARTRLGEPCGKTEAWVILDVEPGARIYAGLKPDVDRGELEARLVDGTIETCLHSFQPRPGDCLYLPAGTVHTVGGGVVLAEVQQPSDATFRLFDWNRLDHEGRLRDLHVADSLAAIAWDHGPIRPLAPQRLSGVPRGVTGEALIRSDFFKLDRFHLGGRLDLPHTGSLSLWMVLDGCCELASAVTGYRRIFHRGETVLIPASARGIHWQPLLPAAKTTLLSVRLPSKTNAMQQAA